MPNKKNPVLSKLAVLAAMLAMMLAATAPALAQEEQQQGGAAGTASGDQYKPGNQSDKATLSFKLAVDGNPPSDTKFFGNVKTGEGGPGLYVPLSDPDGDGTYTGSTSMDRFGPGPRPVPAGVEPVSLPVQIVQGTNNVIKDFGQVKLDGDKTFSASVSFPVDDCPLISSSPEQCKNPGSGDGNSGGHNNGGGGSNDNGSTTGSGSAQYKNSGGSSGGGSSETGGRKAASGSSTSSSGIKLLPATGGALPVAGIAAGGLLIAGGLVVRRLARW